MADTAKTIDQLSKTELGDNKLSKQEVQYLQSKERLWVSDLNGTLLLDIISVNKKSFETPKVKELLDYLTTHFKSIPQFQKILKNKDWVYTSEFNKQCMVLNMLLALSSSSTEGNIKNALLDPSKIAGFSPDTVKVLHAYQKKYEKIAGWSKADCIVGPKTIQQLVMDAGISTVDMVSGAASVELNTAYSSSKKEGKDSYEYAVSSQKAIDAIMKDAALDAVEKTRAMIEVYKKTTIDKKYASATNMILNIKKLLASVSPEMKSMVLASFDKNLQLELKQYWNSANSKKDLGIQKTDEFFKEFENIEKNKIAWNRQFNLIMAVANGWKSYYLSNKKKAEKDLPELRQVDAALRSLQKYKNFDGIDHSVAIVLLLNKIMIPSSGNEQQNKLQKYLISDICGVLKDSITNLAKGTLSSNEDYKADVAVITSKMRTIDKLFDIGGGLFSVNNLESGDAIVDIMNTSSETSPRKFLFKETSSPGAKNYNADMAKLNDIFDNPTNGKLDIIIASLDKTVKGSTTVGGGVYGGGGTTIETRSYDQIAINSALKSVGLENISEKSKKELWKKYNEIKADVEKNARESANSTISSVIQSLEEGGEFAKKQGNAEAVSAINTQLTNWEGFKSGRGSLYIDDKNALLKEMFTNLGIADTTNITKNIFVQKIAALSMNMALSSMIEKVLTVGVLEKHSTLVDNLAVSSAARKNLKLYSNIFGVGKVRSDKTTNMVINVSKEVMVMVIVTVATMGIGSAISAVGSGVLLGARAATTGARIVEGVGALERLGVAASKYKIIAQTALKLSQSANTIKNVGIIAKRTRDLVKAGTEAEKFYSVGRTAFGAGKMIIEGSAFHFSSTAMSNALNGNAWAEGLHDWKGYARTALFLGIFKYVNGILNKTFNLNTTAGIREALSTQVNLSGKTMVITKGLLQGMGSIGAEFAAMQAVDVPLSLVFDGGMPDFSVESLAQTLGFIIGMRGYHGLKKIIVNKADANGPTELTIERIVAGEKVEQKITRAELKKMANETNLKNSKVNQQEAKGTQQENVKNSKEKTAERIKSIGKEIGSYREELARNERVTEGEVLITDKISELEAQLLQLQSSTPSMPGRFATRASKLLNFVNRKQPVKKEEIEAVNKEIEKGEAEVKREPQSTAKETKLNWLGRAKEWIKEFRGRVEKTSKTSETQLEAQTKEALERTIKTEFQSKILGDGIVIGDVTYRIELLQTISQNKNHNKYKLAIYEKTLGGEKLVITETFKENPVENGKINIKKGYKESFQNRLRDLENSYLAEKVANEISKVPEAPELKSSESALLKIRDLFASGKTKISEINDAIRDFNSVIVSVGKKMIGEWKMELEIIKEGLIMKKNEILARNQSKAEGEKEQDKVENEIAETQPESQTKEAIKEVTQITFETGILSREGITIGGVRYRLESSVKISQNKNRNPYELKLHETRLDGKDIVKSEIFDTNPVENGKINIRKGYKESFQSRLRDLENSYLAEKVANEISKVPEAPELKSSESVLLKIRDLFASGKAKIVEINDAIRDFNSVIVSVGKKMIGEGRMELEIIKEGLIMKKNEILARNQNKVENEKEQNKVENENNQKPLETEKQPQKLIKEKEISSDIIERDFRKNPEVKLKNQTINLEFPEGFKYVFIAGRTTFRLSQGSQGDCYLRIENGGNKSEFFPIKPGEKYMVGRDMLPAGMSDRFLSKKHFEITVSENGKVKISDLNRRFGTKVEMVKVENNTVKEVSVNKGKVENSPSKEIIVIKGNEIITAKTSPEQVVRIRDVASVGDLHGEIGALGGNLHALNLVKEGRNGLEWIGGNRKVELLGDIIGDRGTSSFRILTELSSLRKQAQKQGGDIDIIAGNHEDFVFGYLMKNRFGEHSQGISNSLDNMQSASQGVGILEFLKFGNSGKSMPNSSSNFDGFSMLMRGGSEMRDNILKNMRSDGEGRLILNEIVNMKLVNQINDVLYIHTIPTNGILTTLGTYGRNYGGLANGIKEINNLFQRGLKSDLLGEGQLSAQEWSNLNNIMDVFLHTNNRTDIKGLGEDQFFSYLNNNGINFIEHGHEGQGGRITSIKNMEGEDIIRIRDNDYGYGKGGQNFSGRPSVNVIEKNLFPVPAL